MKKVKCIKCGSYGYTASPKAVRCSKCGGKHTIVKADEERDSSYSAPVTNYLKRLRADRGEGNSSCRRTVLVEAL